MQDQPSVLESPDGRLHCINASTETTGENRRRRRGGGGGGGETTPYFPPDVSLQLLRKHSYPRYAGVPTIAHAGNVENRLIVMPGKTKLWNVVIYKAMNALPMFKEILT